MKSKAPGTEQLRGGRDSAFELARESEAVSGMGRKSSSPTGGSEMVEGGVFGKRNGLRSIEW